MFQPIFFVYAGLVVLIATFAFAMWKGEAPERIGGSLNLAAGLFVVAADRFLSPDLVPIAQLVVDAALAMGFLFLAVRFASLWLGVALLLQAVQFSLHAYYLVTEAQHDWRFYGRINNIDTTGINLMIITGTVLAMRRRIQARRQELARAQAQAAAADA